MNFALLLLVFEISVAILMLGFGLRFVFYDEDGPNLDRFYKRYLNGRVRKKYAEFTRTMGFLFLTLVALYAAALIWNEYSALLLLLFGG